MVTVLVVMGVALMLMFATTLALMGKLFYFVIMGLRLVLVVAIIFAITNNVWVYRAVGFTPMSMIFGDKIYSSSLKLLEKHEKPNSKAKTNLAKSGRKSIKSK